jgi:hypothetical protein
MSKLSRRSFFKLAGVTAATRSSPYGTLSLLQR